MDRFFTVWSLFCCHLSLKHIRSAIPSCWIQSTVLMPLYIMLRWLIGFCLPVQYTLGWRGSGWAGGDASFFLHVRQILRDQADNTPCNITLNSQSYETVALFDETVWGGRRSNKHISKKTHSVVHTNWKPLPCLLYINECGVVPVGLTVMWGVS